MLFICKVFSSVSGKFHAVRFKRVNFAIISLKLYISAPCLSIAFVRSQHMQQSDNLHSGATWTTCPSVTQVNTCRDCRGRDAIAWDVSTACVTWEFLWSNDRKIM